MVAIPATGDGLGIAIIAVDVVFLAIAAVAIVLRLWSRRLTHLHFTLNDYLIVLAWPISAGLVVVAITAVVPGGAGQHIYNLPPGSIEYLSKGFPPMEILWALANTAVKISILHLYITIFPKPVFQKFVYATMGLVGGFCLVVVISGLTICRPFEYFYNKSIEGSCGNQTTLVLASCIINLLVDVIIICLPMPLLWGLQMGRHKKIGLCVIFGLGTIICVITILRIVSTLNFTIEDFSYTLPWLAIWTDLEPILGMTNACLPVMRPALKKIFFPSAFGVSSKTSPHNSRDLEYGNPKTRNSAPSQRNLRNSNSQSLERVDDFAAGSDTEQNYSMEQITVENTK
ncbi:MAG: hypothetical protein MMC33_000324 [Icmadophila ericetorum]|nr:hypothetical protein [Icmadophila ericetorum]